MSHGQIKTHWTGALILSPFVSDVVSNLKIPQSTQNDVGASLGCCSLSPLRNMHASPRNCMTQQVPIYRDSKWSIEDWEISLSSLDDS